MPFLLLFGCSGYSVTHASRPLVDALAAPPARLAKICIFRDSLIGSVLTTPIFDNGEIVGATRGPGHFCYYGTEGLHTLTTKVSDAAAFTIRVDAGRAYFVEHSINVGTDQLFGIDEARARLLADRTRYASIEAASEETPVPDDIPEIAGR